MTTKVTEFKDERIIELWYQGISRSEIENIQSTSAGHISEVVQKEKEIIGKGNVDALRRLAKA
jgi:hypothetical protein